MIAQSSKRLAFCIALAVALIFFALYCLTVRKGAIASDNSGAKLPSVLIQVQSPDGVPLPHETIVCVGFKSKTTAVLTGTKIKVGGDRWQTDAEG